MVEEYVGYMTAGVCEMILTSKRAVIYQAFTLANGCLTGLSPLPTKPLKQPSIPVQVKRNRSIYEQQLPLYTSSSQNRNIHSPSHNSVFKSVRELIDLERVLFGGGGDGRYACDVRNGEIVRVQGGTGGDIPGPVKVTYKIKQSLLKQLKTQTFNYYLFTSRSPTLTEQLTSIFLPQCTLFEPTTLLVKPGLLHLVPLIKKSLLEHRFHIITEKQIQMNRSTATEFVYNCMKIRMSEEAMRFVVDVYARERMHVFVVAKVGGRGEVMGMFGGFGFLGKGMEVGMGDGGDGGKFRSKESSQVYLQDQYLSDELLKDMLVPVWNNQQLLLQMIAQPLANLQQSIHLLCQPQSPEPTTQIPLTKPTLSKTQKLHVYNYIIGSFFGVGIQNLDLDTRLGRFTMYIAEEPITPKLQSWYYAAVSKVKPNYVPLLFQYRQIGQTMLVVQSDNGVPFLEKILNMYRQEQEKFKAAELRDQNNFSIRPIKKKQKRRSLVLFLWAKKLAQFCLDLSTTPVDLKDFGPIIQKHSEHRGTHTLQSIQAQQHNVLSSLAHQFDSSPDIKANIQKLLQSRHQKQRYFAENRRLVPSFGLSGVKDSLRVVEKTQTSKLHLMDKYQMIDPTNQTDRLKDLYSLHLYNITPQIRTKYHIVAQLYYHLTYLQFQNDSNPQLLQLVEQLQQTFTDLLSQSQQLQIIEYEIYLKFLMEYLRGSSKGESRSNIQENANQLQFKERLFGLLKTYPNLRKNRKIDTDEVAGKKRKFLNHNQYFKRNTDQSDQTLQTIQKKFTNFDLNTLLPQPTPTPLYNPKDPLHAQFAHPQNRINFLREPQNDKQRPGVYVQFEKNISEKQQMLKEKIKAEADRFKFREDEILYEGGLEKDLWYRRAKGDRREEEHELGKTGLAIQKQISKLLEWKEMERKKYGEG